MRRVLWLIGWAGVLGGLLGVGWAKSFTVKRYEVNIHILSDGDLHITEELTVEYKGGPFKKGFREIDKRYTEAIIIEGVWEKIREEDWKLLNHTVDNSDKYVRVDWFYEQAQDEERVFKVVYKVKGAIRRYEGGDQLWWRPLGIYEAPILESVVRVFLPEGAVVQKVDAYGLGRVVKAEGREVLFEGQRALAPNESFGEIRVQFPHGIIPPGRPSWQWKADLRDMLWDLRFFISIAFLVAAFLLMLMRWYFSTLHSEAEIEGGLPAPDPPALVQLLVEGKVDHRGIISTVVDLARKGFLKIDEQMKSPWEFNFLLERIPNISKEKIKNLRADERIILKAIPHRSTIGECIKRLGELGYGAALWKELEKRGWVTRGKPSLAIFISAVAQAIVSFSLFLFVSESLEYALTATFLIHGFCLLLEILSIWQSSEDDLLLREGIHPGISLGIISLGVWTLAVFIFIFILGVSCGLKQNEWLLGGSAVLLWVVIANEAWRRENWYTAAGRRRRKEWEAFRKWLEEGSLLEEDKQKAIETYLPYAIALKVEKGFIERIEKELGSKLELSWYTRSSSSTGWSVGGSGDGRQAGSQSFSGGQGGFSLSTSLNAFSSAFTSMLNQAASSFARISESGSGGGGWSGGGSSGGGGGGGGRGGFS
jgi:hypothetical protein